jgi:flagellar hook-associated protein 3 FlgL
MTTPVFVNSRAAPILVQASRMSRIADRMGELDKEISTGERFTEPSDDPAAANRAAMLVRMQANLDARKAAVDRANSRLSLAETGIEAANSALLRARDLALTAANGTINADNRTIIAHEVGVLKQQLVDAANSADDDGRHVFGGAANGSKPYVVAPDGTVTWAGFGDGAGAEAAGVAGAAPPAGPKLFGDDLTGAFAQLDKLVAALNEPDDALRTAALADSVTALNGASARLTLGQAMIGASMARLSSETDNIAKGKLDAGEELAKVKGVDLTAAFAEYQALRLTQSAAQASFSKLFDGTLFDRLG